MKFKPGIVINTQEFIELYEENLFRNLELMRLRGASVAVIKGQEEKIKAFDLMDGNLEKGFMLIQNFAIDRMIKTNHDIINTTKRIKMLQRNKKTRKGRQPNTSQ